VHERRGLGRRLHRHDLVGLDVGAEVDDEVRVPVEELLVHREDGIASGVVDEPDRELPTRTYAFPVELHAILERLGLSGAFRQLA